MFISDARSAGGIFGRPEQQGYRYGICAQREWRPFEDAQEFANCPEAHGREMDSLPAGRWWLRHALDPHWESGRVYGRQGPKSVRSRPCRNSSQSRIGSAGSRSHPIDSGRSSKSPRQRSIASRMTSAWLCRRLLATASKASTTESSRHAVIWAIVSSMWCNIDGLAALHKTSRRVGMRRPGEQAMPQLRSLPTPNGSVGTATNQTELRLRSRPDAFLEPNPFLSSRRGSRSHSRVAVYLSTAECS